MNKSLRYLAYAIFLLLPLLCAYANDGDKEPIKVSGDTLSYADGGNTIKAKGNVKVSYQGMTLTCQNATVDLKQNTAIATGNVVLKDKKETITGTKVQYNFTTHKGKLLDSTFSMPPYYGAAPVIEQTGNNQYIAECGYITTCNPKHPHFMDYTLEAEEMEIYTDEKIVAKKVRFKIGKITILYFPKYVHYLNDKRMKVKIVPGHQKQWGAFLLTAWDYTLTDQIDGKMHIDYREHRGWAGGPDIYYHDKNIGNGILRTYYMHERDNRRDPSLGGKKKQRYKIQWAHKLQMQDNSYLMAEFHEISDRDFLKDYYYNEDYEYDVDPDSYLQYSKGLSIGTFSTYIKKRTNKFYTETEYLPRIKFTGNNIPIIDNKVLIKPDFEIANLTYKTADKNNGPSCLRADTKLQATLPFKLGIFQLSPYIGTRQTIYSRSKEGDNGITRGALLTGFDITTKFYRIFDIYSEKLNINRMRHLIQPTLSMDYISEPTTENNKIEQFDGLDSLERSSKLSFSIDNRLQTKRNDKTWDLLRLDFDATYLLRANTGSHLDTSTINLELYPSEKLSFESEYVYDWDKDHWKSARIDSWLNTDIIDIGIGHTYTYDERAQSILQTRFKGIKGITLSTYMRYEFETGAMQEQTYSIVKDLSCWELEVAYEHKKYEDDTLWFILRIKALPDISIRATKSYRAPRTQE